MKRILVYWKLDQYLKGITFQQFEQLFLLKSLKNNNNLIFAHCEIPKEKIYNTVLGLVALLLIVFKDAIAEVLGRNASTGVLIPLRLTAKIYKKVIISISSNFFSGKLFHKNLRFKGPTDLATRGAASLSMAARLLELT